MQKMKSLCLKLVTMYLNSDGGFIYEEKLDKVIGEQGSKQDWKCHV